MEQIPSFNALIEQSIIKNWDLDALTDYKGTTLQYHDVARKIEKLHIMFENGGVKRGDKIALCGRNSANWAVAFFATLTYGAVAVPILHEFTADQVHNIVNHSDAKILFAGDIVAKSIDPTQMPKLEGIINIPDYSLLLSRTEQLTYAREHLNEMFGRKYPKYFRKSERKLARLCRRHSKRKKDGKNRERLRLKVCLAYEKITNQRIDYLHKKSYLLAESYDAVCIETLNMQAMSKMLKFGKSVADNSFGRFREFLDYKLYFRGKKLIMVNKWFASSQLCSSCGYKNLEIKDISIREWKCPSCGTEHDRDINAAINIREEGKRIAAATVGTTGSNAFGEDVRRLQPVRVERSLVELGSRHFYKWR